MDLPLDPFTPLGVEPAEPGGPAMSTDPGSLRRTDQRASSGEFPYSTRAGRRLAWSDLHLASVVVIAVVLVGAAALALALPASSLGHVATALLVCVALILTLVA